MGEDDVREFHRLMKMAEYLPKGWNMNGYVGPGNALYDTFTTGKFAWVGPQLEREQKAQREREERAEKIMSAKIRMGNEKR